MQSIWGKRGVEIKWQRRERLVIFKRNALLSILMRIHVTCIQMLFMLQSELMKLGFLSENDAGKLQWNWNGWLVVFAQTKHKIHFSIAYLACLKKCKKNGSILPICCMTAYQNSTSLRISKIKNGNAVMLFQHQKSLVNRHLVEIVSSATEETLTCASMPNLWCLKVHNFDAALKWGILTWVADLDIGNLTQFFIWYPAHN